MSIEGASSRSNSSIGWWKSTPDVVRLDMKILVVHRDEIFDLLIDKLVSVFTILFS